jgi:hypothetical protein
MNQTRRLALVTMQREEKRMEQALVTITLSTATLITCVGLLVSVLR